MSAFKLKKTVAPYRCGDAMGIRVHIDCEAIGDTPETTPSSHIFAYLPHPDGGHFNHVCNIIDMKECPEDTPPEGKWPKWYRLNYVDMWLPNIDVAYDFIEKVEEEVGDLYRTMVRFNQIVHEVPEEVIIPPENIITGAENGNNG